MECTRRCRHLLKQRPMERKWCRRMESVKLPLSQECPSTVSSCRYSEIFFVFRGKTGAFIRHTCKRYSCSLCIFRLNNLQAVLIGSA